MSKLKDFLDRRAQALAKERQKGKETAGIPPEESNNTLTDDEFWEILRRWKAEKKQSSKEDTEILQDILKHYSPEQILDFAGKYEKLSG